MKLSEKFAAAVPQTEKIGVFFGASSKTIKDWDLVNTLIACAGDTDSEELTEWEATFITDLSEKHEKYGSQTFLSDKQAATLRRIAEKLIPF